MKRISMAFWLCFWGGAITGCDDDKSGEEDNGSGENTPALCNDGVDNDSDGAVDGDDGECTGLVDTDTALPAEWITSWVSGQQRTEPENLPPNPGLAGNTLRQIIHPSLGGDQLRITFSNAYGDAPVTIVSSAVALSAGAKAIVPESHTPLTFSGAASVTIPEGAAATSDPALFQVTPFTNLTVSMLFDGAPPSAVTGHPGSRTNSYLQEGDTVAAQSMGGLGVAHWYFLSALDVRTVPEARSVVIMGDSITDGRGSTTDGNNRWPNQLDKRFKQTPGMENISVLNQGIGGNCVTRPCLGPSFLDRFESDVLGPLKVKQLVLFGGINDLNSGTTAQKMIESLTSLADQAHAAGLSVIGATIMPCEGHSYYSESLETRRQEINAWIRTASSFDGVIDFDAITRDPAQPTRLRADVEDDWLHPSVAGHQIMADAVELTLFQL